MRTSMGWLWSVMCLVSFPVLAANVTVPVDVGLGPAAYYFFGPLTDERWPMPHFGFKLDVQAVIDQPTIQANRRRIPPKYLKMAEKVNEVRISPSLFIPDSFIISPKSAQLGTTGIYGVTWRPVSFGVPLAGGGKRGWRERSPGRLDLSAGLLVTYAFIHSDTQPLTHFLRPGIDLMLELELAASPTFLLSVGWASQFYVPQQLGSFGVGPLNQSIFHVGQAFLQFHIRFPYSAKL